MLIYKFNCYLFPLNIYGRWYHLSALVDKFNWNSDDLEDSSTSSSVHESQSTYSTSDYTGDCETSTDVSYASHGSKGIGFVENWAYMYIISIYIH